MTTTATSFETVAALGDLLEAAQERLDIEMQFLDEDAAEREIKALDSLWSLYQALLDEQRRA